MVDDHPVAQPHKSKHVTVWANAYVTSSGGQFLTKNRMADIIRGLCERGWKVTFIAREVGSMTWLTDPLPNGVEVVPLKKGVLGGLLRRSGVALRHLVSGDPALFFMPLVWTAVAAVLHRGPAVVYAGSAWRDLGAPKWRRVLERLVGRRAAAVISAGDAVKAAYEGQNTSVRLAIPVVEPEVNERFRAGSPAEPNVTEGFTVLFVGGVFPAKRPDLVLEAASSIPNVEVVIVGPVDDSDYGNAIRSQIVDAPLGRLAGYLQWEQLRDEYLNADVLVLPSTAEGFPRVVYEATSLGLPCIVTPVAGVPYRLEDNVSALIVPFDSSAAITEAIQRLRENPELGRRIAANAFQALRGLFTDPDPISIFDHTLMECCAQGKS